MAASAAKISGMAKQAASSGSKQHGAAQKAAWMAAAVMA
jgi:hypothetical protein